MNIVMACRIRSCLVLYLHNSKATLQLLRMWHNVCCSPHNLHATDRWSLFLHRAKLALWGRVSFAAFNANFIWADGRDWVVFAHTAVALESTWWKNLPWVPRERLCSRRLLFRLFVTACFAFLATTLPEAPGSETKALKICAAVKGWNLALCWFASFWRVSLTTWFTPHPVMLLRGLLCPLEVVDRVLMVRVGWSPHYSVVRTVWQGLLVWLTLPISSSTGWLMDPGFSLSMRQEVQW